MTDYSLALIHLYPGAEWGLSNNDYSTLEWLSDSPKPSKKSLDDAWPSVRDALAWGRVRAKRDGLLSSSDWTQVADAPVDSATWAVYRQALRDIPQTFATPDEVVWPTAP